MNTTEHKKYLEDITALSKKILSSKKSTTDFLIEAKINTPTGRITKFYSENRTLIGFKTQK